MKSLAVPKSMPALLAACGLALTLGACANPVDPLTTASVVDDYRVNHPILIEDKVAAIDIPVSANGGWLTDAERSNISFFAQSFLSSGSPVIAVVAPSGSPNQVAAARVAVEVEDVLRRNGINPRAIDYRVYRASAGEAVAPIRIAYSRIAATTAPCGLWTDDVTASANNRHYGAYGCATQQNLAAAVANPLDLLYPRGMTPADAARRATVLDRYRQGSPFKSAESLEGGTVATGVGQ